MAPAQKIGRALKSAALLPVKGIRASTGRRSTSTSMNPQPGEEPMVILRLQILGCEGLIAKDRGGTSDPFVVCSLLSTRYNTPVSKKTLNPTYAASTATFDFPLYASLQDKLGVLELIVWDKDTFGKDYLGEVGIPLEAWFVDHQDDDEGGRGKKRTLLSTKSHTVATGTITIKLGFVLTPNSQSAFPEGRPGEIEREKYFEEVYSNFMRRSRPSLVSAPPTEGVGTIRSHQQRSTHPLFEDDGGLSSSEDEGSESESESGTDSESESETTLPTPTLPEVPGRPAAPPTLTPSGNVASPPPVVVSPPTSVSTPKEPASASSTKESFTAQETKEAPAKPSKSAATSKSSASSSSVSLVAEPVSELGVVGGVSSSPEDSSALNSSKSKKFGRKTKTREARKEYSLGTDNDIVGIVMLEIRSAEDLPKLSNMTRTGWDMDPFVVISFGKKVFRTRVIRHSRNPVWDEKLLFHVRRYEIGFKVHFSILDWDKLSSNDHIGDASFDVKELLDSAPQPDASTGLYGKEAEESGEMKDMKMKLSAEKGGVSVKWDAKYSPELSIRAKFQPYAALRQKFWRTYLNQYDTDDTATLSRLELTSMLDSLGSTLTPETIASFWTRFNKDEERDELSMEEAIMCLETELGRPVSERKMVKPPISRSASSAEPENAEDVLGAGNSVIPTPLVMHGLDAQGREINLDEMDFSGRPRVVREESTDSVPSKLRFGKKTKAEKEEKKALKQALHQGGDSEDSSPEPSSSPSSSSNVDDSSGAHEGSGAPTAPSNVERVINVKNCPMCHRPRMKSKAEMDIITHMAICASQDWGSVDKIMVGNFVTASQAQRKWYTKVLSKVSSGNYKLGANSANIIVQNRATGQLEEEKMQVYVRLGIRLLYKGAKSQMEGARARKLLKSLSIKQGVKYDSALSAAEIPGFIEFHNLDLNEILDPLDSFKTFNEFFYRKLKKSARPVEEPENPYRLVSAADCRFMAFESVSSATQIWIKGRDFSVAKLLGPEYKEDWGRYDGGALAIFRLAPQDYHRFHVPVSGKIGKMKYISGEYYTVNPQAIRTALDVYGENARKIVPIDSPQFGRVMAVCVGAMMVGSIETTVEEGQTVNKGDEFGYFAFGGSTIVILFEAGAVEWDEDLLINGRASLETLVRVNSGLGRGNSEFKSSVPGLTG
ncbi:phosphatidylserine decarboxylase-domain-containing protein [Coprinopsis sp. MPI-PUGE-AT-0042]|nr:phosphatidylserine decarboxylase-domain-containing protein [Coprinopsis sp. MPI-PUGE-AT-0042]